MICLIAVSLFAVLMPSVIYASGGIPEDRQLTTDLNTDRNPVVLRDNTSKIWIFFESDRPGGNPWAMWYVTSDDAGKTWSSPQLLITSMYPNSPFSESGIDAMQDSSGKTWLVFSTSKTPGGGDNEIWFMTSDDGGNTWSDPTKPYEGTSSWPGYGSPTIVEAFSKIWIFFMHWEGFKYVTSDDGGLTWSSPIYFGHIAGKDAFHPQCIRDVEGNLWLFYERQLGYGTGMELTRNITYIRSNDGVTWSQLRNVEEMGPGPECYPWAVQETSGSIIVFFDAYQDYITGYDRTIYYVVSQDDGATWSDPEQFTEDGLLVFWVSNRSGNWDIWFKSFAVAPLMHALIDIDPNTLNLRSKGKWITCYIELPEGYDVNGINVSTILLNGTVPAELHPTEVGDYDGDGVPDLMVKFDRAEVTSYILANVNMTKLIEEKFMTITLTITGELDDGTPFQGSDTITIMLPTHGKRGIFPL